MAKIEKRINAAFEIAEQVGRFDPSEKKGSDFTWFLADALRKTNYDGFAWSGIRGEAGARYQNIVVFEPGQHWRDWSKRERGFTRDPES